MRYHLAEAIRINTLPDGHRRAAIDQLPLGTRTIVAVLAKHLQGGRHDYERYPLRRNTGVSL